MAKLTLVDLTNLENQTSSVATLASNNTATETAMEKTLSRDGTSPNAMETDLDMDSNSIINLPDPTTNTEPVTLGFATLNYGDSLTNSTAAAASATAAAASAVSSASSASSASTSASNAATSETNASASATAAASALAAVAYKYTWSTDTTATDPTTGKIKVNNAAPGSATALYISETDANGNNLASEIARWDDSTNSTGRARIKIAKDATNFLLTSIASAVTDSGTWDSATASGSSLTGTLSNGDTVYISAAASGADGAGDVSANTASTSVDNEIVLFSGIGGKTIKRASTTGILKGTSGVISTATASTDYAPATSGSSILKGNGSGGFSTASAGTDYYNPGGTDVAVVDGGTGASSAATALSNLSARGQGKETLFIPAGAMFSRTTNGPAIGSVEMTTNKNMVRSLDFDTTTQQFAQFSVWFPKSWNLGTVTFQPSFSQLTTAAGGVVFGLAGVAVSDGDALDVAFGTAQTSTKTAGTANLEYQGPESSAITIAGTPTAGDRVLFQINRTVADASDTLAQNARLHGVRLFFTTNATTDA